MATENLTYADLGERLGVSAQAARALARRLCLPRQKANDGKILVAVDMTEIDHKPKPAAGRSRAGSDLPPTAAMPCTARRPEKMKEPEQIREPLSVGPMTASEDEQVIARSYRHWPWYLVPAAIPLCVAWFADEKTVIAVGFAGVILLGLHVQASLHDLCTRLRRTNLLLRGIIHPNPIGPSLTKAQTARARGALTPHTIE
jgi:hypothetical protein